MATLGGINRVQVSSSDSGPYNFRFQVNPMVYDPQDSNDVSSLNSVHGSNHHQKPLFDDRVRTLEWVNTPMSNVKLDNVVDYFRSIVGEIRYFNFKDIDDINSRWPSSSDWKKTRIIGLDIRYKEGGSLVYSSVKLKIQPEI